MTSFIRKTFRLGIPMLLASGTILAACSSNSSGSSGNSGNSGTSSGNSQKPAKSYSGPNDIISEASPTLKNTMWILAGTARAKTLVQMNLASGSLSSPVPASSDAVSIAETTQNILAVGTSTGTAGAVSLYQITSGKPVLITTAAVSAPVVEVVPSADGSLFFVLTARPGVAAVQELSTASGKLVGGSIGVSSDVISIVPTSDGNDLFTLEPNGLVSELPVSGAGAVAKFNVGADAKLLALSQDSQTLYALKCPPGSCNVSIVNVVGQQVEKVIPAPLDTVQIQISPDDSLVWDAVGNGLYGNVQAFSL